MTTVPYPTTSTRLAAGPAPTWVDRLAITSGTALARWGERRARLHTAPAFADQTDLFEAHRHQATRDLPILPR